ncbi:MAG: hypothetical protein HY259_11705 [Chloroflexi bacterium]|nr:hypothetical protein [Chloroflexota bacterium]MBI3734100.1 hypothetical protein [Chloroflexota bacterium]
MQEREVPTPSDIQPLDPRRMLDQGLARLQAELQAGQFERLEQYLTFVSRFHLYSAYNQMLILEQCPAATQVAGYRTWQKLGYQVRRGEKGIRILAPQPYKRTDPESGREEAAIAFKLASVFDASQLANLAEKPLPRFFTPLADDQPALYQRLLAVVRAEGITVSTERLARAQGTSAGGRIALREGLDSRNAVLTLLHEYTHELLHWGAERNEISHPVRECHAEAVAFVVAHHFGVENPYSAAYLHHWGTTPKALVAELETVRRTAASIIRRVEQPDETDAGWDGQPVSVALRPMRGQPAE